MGLSDNKSRMPEGDFTVTMDDAADDYVIQEGTGAQEDIAVQETEEGPLEFPADVPADDDGDDVVGIIYGNVGTTHFDCRVTSHLERSEYVSVFHEEYGPVLCQVGSLLRKSNLSLEKSISVNEDTIIEELVSAHIEVVGYRDDRGLLQKPRMTFKAGSKVHRAQEDLIRNVLGLTINPRTDGFIGLLHGHDLPVALNINELLQRHACILAKTGGGKSYMSGDIIEELMKHNVTCMIFDPHGEYGAMRDAGSGCDPRFGVEPRGSADRINEFAIEVPPLRDRLEDFDELTAFFIRQANEATDSRHSAGRSGGTSPEPSSCRHRAGPCPDSSNAQPDSPIRSRGDCCHTATGTTTVPHPVWRHHNRPSTAAPSPRTRASCLLPSIRRHPAKRRCPMMVL